MKTKCALLTGDECAALVRLSDDLDTVLAQRDRLREENKQLREELAGGQTYHRTYANELETCEGDRHNKHWIELAKD